MLPALQLLANRLGEFGFAPGMMRHPLHLPRRPQLATIFFA